MKRTLPLLLFTILFFSCNNINTCLNKTQLTATDKTDLVLKLNYNQPQEALIETIKSHFKEDICWKEKTIGLQINNCILKTIFQETCPMKMMGLGVIPSSEVKILVNPIGEILINDEYFTTLDTLSDWIGKNFPNQIMMPYRIEEVSLLWHEETPKEKIEKVLLLIEEGYLKSYERISNKKFKKPICDLSDSEFLELKETFDFRIKLGFAKLLPPIPPPPPTDEEIEENFIEY